MSKSKIRFVGVDVHADTIAVAVAEPDGEVRSLGAIPNRLESIRKMVAKPGPAEGLKACCEAGPSGYVLYRQLTALKVPCEVIAPSLVPVKAGDRVKTDRRDAVKARSYRAGDLAPVWVPDADHEACAISCEPVKTRNRTNSELANDWGSSCCATAANRPADVKRNSTNKHMDWVKRQVRFEQPALQATFLDYVHEVGHAADHLQRLEKAIDDAVAAASAEIQEVVKAL
jgi:transposase